MFPKKDDDAVLYTANVLKKLHQERIVAEEFYPSIKDWLSSITSNDKIPKMHIDKAQAISRELLCSQERVVLLHGDLHHDNILSDAQGEWIAIDPKGVIGDPIYEVGAFIRNPIHRLLKESYNPLKKLSRRIKIFAECLNADKERIKQWSYVQSVLAACWAAEDLTAWEQWITCAELIDRTIP